MKEMEGMSRHLRKQIVRIKKGVDNLIQFKRRASVVSNLIH
jgi:hypothetical protein